MHRQEYIKKFFIQIACENCAWIAITAKKVYLHNHFQFCRNCGHELLSAVIIYQGNEI